jgi:DNA-binding GntR family transcriptional regulator
VTVDYHSEQPPYRQVAAIIAAQIERGDLGPGDPVPSVTRLMQEYGIARTTAGKVLRYLRDEGLVVISPGWGTFVKR